MMSLTFLVTNQTFKKPAICIIIVDTLFCIEDNNFVSGI